MPTFKPGDKAFVEDSSSTRTGRIVTITKVTPSGRVTASVPVLVTSWALVKVEPRDVVFMPDGRIYGDAPLGLRFGLLSAIQDGDEERDAEWWKRANANLVEFVHRTRAGKMADRLSRNALAKLTPADLDAIEAMLTRVGA